MVALAIALVSAACAGSADTGPPTDVAPSAPAGELADGGTRPVIDPTIGLSELTWLAPMDPFGEADLASTEVEDWPALFAAMPRPVTADPLDVTMRLIRDPDACTLWHRTVTAVDLGPGEAAQRMAATVMDVLRSGDHAAGPLLGPGDGPWCDDRPRDTFAFLATDVSPSSCGTGDDRDLRCITVTTLRYDGGAHANTFHTDLVLDRATGELHDLTLLLAPFGLDVASGTALAEQLVCDLDRAEGLLVPMDGCWEVLLRNVRPTPTGLLLSFSPYESGPYAFGPRDLFVPTDVLASGPSVPPAVRETQQALADAVRDGDWDAIAALLPADGVFAAGFGAPGDPIAHYRSLGRDPLAEWLVVLTQPAGSVVDLTVWPELHARDPFAIAADERGRLAAAFGEDLLRSWEAGGAYLGWRAGFDADGTWRFMVAGD